MDLYKAIRELYADKQKLDLIIAALEQLESAERGGQASPTNVAGENPWASKNGKRFRRE
jgi:hypothetical protein